MKKLIGISVVSLLAAGLLNSCTKAIIDEEPIIVMGDTSGTAPVQELFYDPQIKKIMTDNCITCHGGPAPSAGLNLETYNAVKEATQNGNLIDRINDQTNPMPQRGLMPLATRKEIELWAKEGFKEKK